MNRKPKQSKPTVPTFAQEWREFISKIAPDLPKDSDQYRDLKITFYAGAHIANTLAESITNQIEDVDECCIIYGQRKIEVLEFHEELNGGPTPNTIAWKEVIQAEIDASKANLARRNN